MSFQEKFTKASRTYLDLQRELIEVSKLSSLSITKEEILKNFDILIQLLLLELTRLDGIVDFSELAFIKKLSLEVDIFDVLNSTTNSNYSWEALTNDTNLLNDVILKLKALVSSQMNLFISFIASLDAITDKNYAYILSQGIKELLILFNEANQDSVFYKALEEIFEKEFMSVYKEEKAIFSQSLKFNL